MTLLTKMNDLAKSPCIHVCQKHTVDGLDYCAGCYRTMDEIQWWPKFEDHIQEHIVKQCHNRRNHIHKDMGFDQPSK